MGKEIYKRGGREPSSGGSLFERFAWFAEKYPMVDFGKAILDGYSWEKDLYLPLPEEEGFYVYTERVLLKRRIGVMPDLYNEERARKNLKLLWPSEVTLYPLAQTYAAQNDIDTSGIPQRRGSLRYSPTMFDRQTKIDVDLTEQYLTAYEGNVPVLHAPVSTGKPGYETPAGNFRVTWKPEYLDYRSPFKEVRYFQPQVPFNMMFEYLNYIHGAYWHDEFATTQDHGRSYGCVNLDMDEAGWLYAWTPYSTPVRIHY